MEYKFSCTQCGECCRWDGVVKLTPKDTVKISAYLGQEIPEFIKKYTKKDNFNNRVLKNKTDIGLKEDPKGCVFLKDNKCSIHEVAPEQCSEYPNKYDARCPGFEPSDDQKEKSGEIYMDSNKKSVEADDFDKRVMENLFKSLEKGVKPTSVAAFSLSSPDSGMDVFLNDACVRKIKIASLDDLFSFHRISADTLVHKSNKELWSIKKDDKSGEIFIERNFNADSGEPLKV